jgi:hypothetical protein
MSGLKESLRGGRAGRVIVSFCYDPTVITGPKTFASQRLSTLFDLKDFCKSQRSSGFSLPPPSEIFLPTDARAR